MSRFCLPMMLFALVTSTLAFGAEFTPDANTLLLAHFNDNVHEADYACGLSLFAGNGATLTEGVYGRGIDLRRRGLSPDFVKTCADYTPSYTGWGFHPRGNVDPVQGTFECWLKVAQPDSPRMPFGGNLLNGDLGRQVLNADKKFYTSFTMNLDYYRLTYNLPTLAKNVLKGEVVFKQVPGFGKTLDPNDWHHFALCWSPGELSMWLDGRLAATCDMTGQLALIILSNPVRYLNMSDLIVDELRISNTVRYTRDFEPDWRDGQRPAYAFPGVAGLQRYDAKLVPPVVPAAMPAPAGPQTTTAQLGDVGLTFNNANGQLLGLTMAGRAAPAGANGLQLYRGLEHVPVAVQSLQDLRRKPHAVTFTQSFADSVTARQEITRVGEALRWRVTLRNGGQQETWLEPLLSLPVPLAKVTEVFDGCQPRQVVNLPRRRQEYCSTLPFVAAADASSAFGVGLDPHTGLSDIVSEWVPLPEGGVLRQGTRLVLSPGESYTYDFYLVNTPADFATLDALAAFHGLFPDLYHLRPDVPVYSYMPASQHYEADKCVDMKRQGYAGGMWGHGPGHDKGDEFGTTRWWANPALDEDAHYKSYARNIERLWGTIFDLRQIITMIYRQSWENFYPVRRFHTCPDMTPEYIIKDIWPGYVPNEDPLCFGQYYGPIWQAYVVNEYNTPLGRHFCDQTREYYRKMAGSTSGYINDMSHAGALYRHNDEIAQRTPGRSFSSDLGPFVRKALGRQQRYELINSFADAGHRMSIWSDGGAFSYTLCAFSSAIAIEGGGMYKDLVGPGDYAVPARYMLGQKPLTAMTHMNDDWIGRYLPGEKFTPESLRDYYRFCERQLLLFGIEHGITFDPTSYFWGRQWSWETQPIAIESTALGRQVVPAARVKEPLWVCRSGEGLGSFLVVGNYQPQPLQSDLELVNRYYGGAPLLVPYYGGTITEQCDPQRTTVAGVTVSPRDLAAFKTCGLLSTPGAATINSKFSGDGLGLVLDLTVDTRQPAELLLSDFGPMYEISGLTIGGQAAPVHEQSLNLPAGKTSLRVSYANRSLPFTQAQWEQVDLIKAGQTNFCLQADPGVQYVVNPKSAYTFMLGFERGTAQMLNDFVDQYDEENGVVGDLKPAEYVTARPEGFTGWLVRFQHDETVRPGQVRLDLPKREIVLTGATQGEMRRAMVVFLRMLDRKYPHVGRFFPLKFSNPKYENGQPVPIEKWVPRKDTWETFKQLSDPLFLVKPILREEFEGLYKGDRMDFAGQYTMRFSPYIFEPTYGDDFVYGYEGPGTADTKEALMKPAQTPAVEQ